MLIMSKTEDYSMTIVKSSNNEGKVVDCEREVGILLLLTV